MNLWILFWDSLHQEQNFGILVESDKRIVQIATPALMQMMTMMRNAIG